MAERAKEQLEVCLSLSEFWGPFLWACTPCRMSWRSGVKVSPNPTGASGPVWMVFASGRRGSYLKLRLSPPSPVLREGCHLTPKITGPPRPSSRGYSGLSSDPPFFPQPCFSPSSGSDGVGRGQPNYMAGTPGEAESRCPAPPSAPAVKICPWSPASGGPAWRQAGRRRWPQDPRRRRREPARQRRKNPRLHLDSGPAALFLSSWPLWKVTVAVRGVVGGGGHLLRFMQSGRLPGMGTEGGGALAGAPHPLPWWTLTCYSRVSAGCSLFQLRIR